MAPGQPRQATLLGRDRELAWLTRQTRPAVVAGLPGIGKTTLLEVASARNTSTWVDATLLSPERVLKAIQDAPAEQQVVVDQLEELHPTLIAGLEALGPRRVVLGTVSASGWEGPLLHLNALPTAAAAAILERRLDDQLVEPMPTMLELTRLASASEGMPCVLETIVRSIPVMGTGATLQRLEADPPDLPQCSVDQSGAWAQLPDPHRDVLTQLACLGGETPVSILEAVMGRPIGADLTDLHARSWLAPPLVDGHVRLYRVVRGRIETLTTPDRVARARERATAWAQACAEELLQRTAVEPELLGEESTLDGFLHLYLAGRAPDTDPFRAAFDALLTRYGSPEQHTAFLDEALPRVEPGSATELRLRASRASCGLHHRRGTVLEDTERVLAIAPPHGVDVVRALGLRALFLQQGGDARGAEADLAQAGTQVGDAPVSRAILLLATGEVGYAAGDLSRAEAALRSSHDEAIRAGERTLAASALAKLAVVLADAMRIDAARVALDQARHLRSALGRRTRVALSMTEGRIAMLAGDLEYADATLRETLALAEQIHLAGACTLCETSLAWIALARGDVDTALELAMSSFGRWSRHRNPLWLGSTRIVLAVVHLHQDEPGAARELLHEAHRNLVTDIRNHVLARQLDGLVAYLHGDAEQALAQLHSALPLAAQDPLVSGAHASFMAVVTEGARRLPGVPPPYRGALEALL